MAEKSYIGYLAHGSWLAKFITKHLEANVPIFSGPGSGHRWVIKMLKSSISWGFGAIIYSEIIRIIISELPNNKFGKILEHPCK